MGRKQLDRRGVSCVCQYVPPPRTTNCSAARRSGEQWEAYIEQIPNLDLQQTPRFHILPHTLLFTTFHPLCMPLAARPSFRYRRSEAREIGPVRRLQVCSSKRRARVDGRSIEARGVRMSEEGPGRGPYGGRFRHRVLTGYV